MRLLVGNQAIFGPLPIFEIGPFHVVVTPFGEISGSTIHISPKEHTVVGQFLFLLIDGKVLQDHIGFRVIGLDAVVNMLPYFYARRIVLGPDGHV